MNAAKATVDTERAQADREHFDSIAGKYVAKDLVPSSKCARKLRLESMLGHIPMQPTWRILEVGCGAGFAATYLRGRYASYLGCDHSQELIRAAGEYNSGPDVTFLNMDIEDLADSEEFDLIFMVGVLHHLANRPSVMARLKTLLRPGGFLAVNEPQPSNFLISMARQMRASMDAMYSDDQDELEGDEIRDLFESAGLTDVEIIPQGVFSTPFAEVPMRPDWLVAPIARAACSADALFEPRLARFLKPLTWNLTAIGRCPEDSVGGDTGDGGDP